jgi:hypothetical protein
MGDAKLVPHANVHLLLWLAVLCGIVSAAYSTCALSEGEN